MEERKHKKSILRIMLSVSGIVLLAKILGFVKQMVVANAFGATIHTDIITLSEGLVANTDYLLVQAVATAFVPTYIRIRATDETRAKPFVSNCILFFLTVTAGIALLMTALSPLIARILAPSYSPELSAQLAQYIRICAPIVIIIVEIAIFSSILKSNERFAPAEMVGLNQSLILILLVLIIGGTVGPDTLVIGLYAYAVFNLVFLTVCSRKHWGLVRSNPFRDPDVRGMIRIMGPLILGYAMVFINQQVDKVIVSGLGEGVVTAMGYASVLSNFICTFIGSISGVLFTYITQRITDGREAEAADLATQSTVRLATFLIPISILTVMNAPDIVRIVFGRGKFDEAAVAACSKALIGYGLMFVPYIIREIFTRVQYAYGDTKRPMLNSTMAIVLNIGLSILLSRFWDVLGVTLATSISVAACGLLNIRSSFRRNRHFKVRGLLRCVPQWILGTAACVGISLLGGRYLASLHTILRFGIITAASLGVYAAINFSTVKALIRGGIAR